MVRRLVVDQRAFDTESATGDLAGVRRQLGGSTAATRQCFGYEQVDLDVVGFVGEELRTDREVCVGGELRDGQVGGTRVQVDRLRANHDG